MRSLKFLAALVYRFLYRVNRAVLLRKRAPLSNAPKLFVVGSFRAGGAGKTPVVAALAREFLSQKKRVLVLAHSKAFDEVAWLKKALPAATVVATRNRYGTLRSLVPNFDVALCDDGFEDSRLSPDEIILLDWGEAACKLSELVPLGGLRSLRSDHPEVTRVWRCSGEAPEVKFRIDSVRNENGAPLQKSAGATLICGLGDPERFSRDLENFGVKISRKIFRKDHDRAFGSAFQNVPAPIVISEKDRARLPEKLPKHLRQAVYIAHQVAEIPGTFRS